MTPEAFAAACREIVAEHRGHAAHRQLDLLATELLVQLGYEEGARIFSSAVRDWHHPQLRYPFRSHPRFLCRIGRHRWRDDEEAAGLSSAAEICTECGKRRSFNPCP